MKILSTRVVVASMMTLLWASPSATAQALEAPSELTQESTLLTLTMGNAMILPLPGKMERIAVANEEVATAMVLSKTELLIRPEGNGRSSLFVWMADGSLEKYLLHVQRDLDDLRESLTGVGGRIDVVESADGSSILLRGHVDDAATAMAAVKLAETLVTGIKPEPPRVVNLISFPADTVPLDADARLRAALASIDPRIEVRRIQVGDEVASGADSYVLEGRVKTIADLRRAITLAERQLGGIGGTIKAADGSQLSSSRNRTFNQGFTGAAGSGDLQALKGQERPEPGLAIQVSRGLVLTSESGRVISFLEVDELHQIVVAIRVLEIDRRKARSLGINYRVDADQFSIANYTSPLGQSFGDIRGAPASVTSLGAGNIVGAYVSSSVAILGAVDFLEGKNVARSVAEPNVMTLTGEDATVVVGGEVPIPTTAVGEVAALQGFDFQSFGVRLDIRPTVDEEGIITLEVAPSIVRPDAGLAVGEVPGFQVQSVQTTARVKGGESLLLGGLLTFEEGQQERKVPLLGNIPVISPLFSWKEKTREERELLFVITPRLLKDQGVDGLEEPIDLPSLASRDYRIGAEVEPQTSLRDGRPSSWEFEKRIDYLDRVTGKFDRAVPEEEVVIEAEAPEFREVIVAPPDVTPSVEEEPAEENPPDSEDALNAPVPMYGRSLPQEPLRQFVVGPFRIKIDENQFLQEWVRADPSVRGHSIQ